MRKIFVAIIAIIGLLDPLFGQTKPQTKPTQTKLQVAEKLINNYLAENLNDFKSYEPMSYSAFDTLRLPLVQDLTFQKLLEEGQKIMKEYKEFEEAAEYGVELFNEYRITGYLETIDKLRKDVNEKFDNEVTPAIAKLKAYEFKYIGKPIGLKLIHKYRAKNKFGGVEIYRHEFGFDFGITEIISVHEITE